MFERFFPFWMTGIFVSLLISALVIAFGYFIRRNYPAEIKELTREKFALYATIPIIFGILFSQLFINLNATTDFSNELKSEESVDKSADFVRGQSNQIELLKNEIKNLREDSRKLNDYLGIVLLFSAIGLTKFVLYNVSKIDKKILDEKRKEKILNL